LNEEFVQGDILSSNDGDLSVEVSCLLIEVPSESRSKWIDRVIVSRKWSVLTNHSYPRARCEDERSSNVINFLIGSNNDVK
jgi:hypothetical protein